MGSICIESLEKEQERHVREMKRARNFIRGKRGKTEFELCVIDSFDHFFDQAKEAVRQMNSLISRKRITDRLEAAELVPEGSGENQGYLCHGDLDQHHVLMGNGYTAIIEYNRMHMGVPGRRPVPAYAKSNGKTQLGL